MSFCFLNMSNKLEQQFLEFVELVIFLQTPWCLLSWLKKSGLKLSNRSASKAVSSKMALRPVDGAFAPRAPRGPRRGPSDSHLDAQLGVT